MMTGTRTYAMLPARYLMTPTKEDARLAPPCTKTAYENGAKSFSTSQIRCGASASPPTTMVTQGAGERKYFARRGSVTAATASPSSSTPDQYFPYIATAAKRPASAASRKRRVSNERRKNKVVAAQRGISTVLRLNLSA